MNSALKNFANHKASLYATDSQTHQPDPQRTKYVQLNNLRVRRDNAPNSGQHRTQDQTPQNTHEQKRHDPCDAFEGSVLGNTTISTASRGRAEDNQFGSQAQAVELPSQDPRIHLQNLQREGDYEDDDENDDEASTADENGNSSQIANALNVVNGFLHQGMVNARVNSPSVLGRLQKGDSYPSSTENGQSTRGDDSQQPHEYACPATVSNTRGQTSTHTNSGMQLPLQKSNTRQPASDHSKDDFFHRHIPPVHLPAMATAHSFRDMPTRTCQNPYLNAAAPKASQQGVHFSALARPAEIRPTTTTDINHSTRSVPVEAVLPQSVAAVVKDPIVPQVDVASFSLHGAILTAEDEAMLKSPYQALHTEQVDNDRPKATDILRQADAQKSLEDQLHIVLKMGAEEKHDFMTSLSIDQWEDAGHWLMDRFGEVMAKMIDARKERRRLTENLGKEIYDRHKHVESKKRGIEVALKEMGKTGNQVLRSGTPKRARR